MSFPRYPKYKDSGVEWLGNVPEHWEVKRLRFVANLNPSKSEVSAFDSKTLVSFLPMEAIGDDGSLMLQNEKTIGEVETGYTYFRNGDVAVAKITPCYENGKGALMRGLVNGIGFGTTELIVARPRPDEVNGTYLHYIFISPDFRSIGESHMYGAGGQKRVPDAFVRNFSTAFPPTAEQTAIAAFLDQETAKIDGLVAEQRRLMELLKEKRQAVISHAVTGKDEVRSMKDKNGHSYFILKPSSLPKKPSGIEWLGDVPEHWSVGSLRYYARFSTGSTPSREVEHFWNGDIPWVKTGEINYATITCTEETITNEGLESCAVSLAPPGTLLMALYGQGVTRGRVALLGIHATFNQACVAISPDQRINGNFLRAFFMFAYSFVRESGNENTQMNLSAEYVRGIRIPIPPPAEQQAIVAHLDTELAKFDALTAEAQRAIDLLQERRTALISAAVTGQIDVRQV